MGGVSGYKRTRKGRFTEFANQLPEPDPDSPSNAAALRYQQGINHDPVLDTASIDLPENSAKTPGGRTLAVINTPVAPRAAYSESTLTTLSHFVEKRQKQVSPAYHTAARSFDSELGSQPGSPGPVESELNTYNSGNVLGLVVGAYAELTNAFQVIIGQIASQLANVHPQFFDIDH